MWRTVVLFFLLQLCHVRHVCHVAAAATNDTNSHINTPTPFSQIRDFNESRILGDWSQIYTNRLVQETEEPSWKCVSVNISERGNGGNGLAVTKQAFLNGNKSKPVNHVIHIHQKVPNKQQLSDDTNDQVVPIPYVSDEDETEDIIYTLRDYDEQYNYLVWTKNDNASIYVWTRNVIEFKVNYDWKVLEKFVSWNYTGYYLFPLASYSFECMNKKNSTS